jgi:hypothetical protein
LLIKNLRGKRSSCPSNSNTEEIANNIETSKFPQSNTVDYSKNKDKDDFTDNKSYHSQDKVVFNCDNNNNPGQIFNQIESSSPLNSNALTGKPYNKDKDFSNSSFYTFANNKFVSKEDLSQIIKESPILSEIKSPKVNNFSSSSKIKSDKIGTTSMVSTDFNGKKPTKLENILEKSVSKIIIHLMYC